MARMWHRWKGRSSTTIATHCSTPATHCSTDLVDDYKDVTSVKRAFIYIHCNTLLRTATHWTHLQHTCNTLQRRFGRRLQGRDVGEKGIYWHSLLLPALRPRWQPPSHLEWGSHTHTHGHTHTYTSAHTLTRAHARKVHFEICTTTSVVTTASLVMRFTHTPIRRNLRLHTYAHTQIQTHKYVAWKKWVHIHARAHTHINTHAHAHTYSQAPTRTHMHKYTHKHKNKMT